MFKAVARVFQHGPSPAIDDFEWGSEQKQALHEADVTCPRSPVQCGSTGIGRIIRVRAMLEQKDRNVLFSTHAGQQESILQLLLCCRRKETLHQLESSHTGGGFQIERRAVIGKEPGRVRLTVREQARTREPVRPASPGRSMSAPFASKSCRSARCTPAS